MAEQVVQQGHVEACAKRIRGYRDGRKVVDTVGAQLVWEVPFYPAYYLPRDDVDVEVAASSVRSLNGLIRLPWNALDAWFEEDEEVFVHPRSPYVRVDALASSRRVRVSIDGHPVADTQRPTLLFETGLPTRYYIPQPDVRMELLEPTATKSGCPYKGTAHYWTVRTSAGSHDDIAWSYSSPFAESQKIAGLVAFYNERTDIEVDGVLQQRPRTTFS